MRIVPRVEWHARPPTSPLVPYAPGAVQGIVWHWNGPPVNRNQNPLAVVKSTQVFHQDVRGWKDIAYNLAIDWNGVVYEGRGIYHQNGASGSSTPNKTFIAVEFMLGEGQKLTKAQVAVAPLLSRYILDHHPNAKRQTVHLDWFNTACPGPEVTARVRAGEFDASNAPTPTPPPPIPTPKDDEMYFLFKLHPHAAPGEPGEWLVTPGGEKFADDSGLSSAIPSDRLTVVDLSGDRAKSLTFRNGHP